MVVPLPFKSPRRAKKTYQGVAGGLYTLVDTIPLWKDLHEQLMIQPSVACDTETTGLDSTRNSLIGFSYSWGAQKSYYVPIGHTTNEKQLKWYDIEDDLRAFYARRKLVTIWHHAKFDLHFLLRKNLHVKGVIQDTLILHKLLKEEGSAELKNLAVQEIDPKANMWEKLIDEARTKLGREKIPSSTSAKPVMRKKANVHFGMVNLDIMCPYAASDTHYTWILFKKKFCRVASEKELRELYIMEMKLLRVLLAMESHGVLIDQEYLKEAGPKLEAEAERYRLSAVEKLGDPDINVGSNDQLIKAFQRKGINLYKKTEKGRYSLDAQVLEKLATKYAVCEDILSFRRTRKLKTTYIDNIQERTAVDGHLHCEYNQNVVTGRMSSRQPNLQNIPARDKTIRKAFICPEDFVMVFIDYSQVEVRMTAHYCLQRNMRVRFAGGESVEIGTLVNQQQSIDVESFDFETRQIVQKPVINYWRNNKSVEESIYRAGTDDWIIIRHEGAPHRKLVVTPQHEIYLYYNKKIQAKNIKVGDLILFREPELCGNALQIFLGSMLGDGNFKFSKSTKTKNPVENLPSANFYHGESQENYFFWKESFLKPFMTNWSKPDHMFRGRIKSSFQIKKLADKMVVNGIKKPTMQIIDMLNPLGLAIWYLDDGCLSHDDRCSNLKGWSVKINNIQISQKVINKINNKFSLSFSKIKDGFSVSGYRLEKFFELIAKYIPPCMEYKLPPHWRGFYTQLDTSVTAVVPAKVVEKRKAVFGEPLFKRNLTQASFDIEVESTHNYFAQDVLVSNSEDPALLRCYTEPPFRDVHTNTMCEMFEYNYDEVAAILEDEKHPMHEEISFKRKVAKSTNFLIIYGGGAKNLSEKISTPRKQYSKNLCQTYIDNYLNNLYGVKRWISRTKKRVRKDTYVRNVFGRYRRFPELINGGLTIPHKDREWKIARAERQAVNFLIQGTCADLFKEAMVRVAEELKGCKSQLIMTIHDEIVMYMHKSELKMLKTIKKRMEDWYFKVPIIADVSFTNTCWAEKKRSMFDLMLVQRLPFV